MVANVIFGLAEIEMEYRRERQIACINVAKKAGVYKGRKQGTTKRKPNKTKNLKGQGLSIEEITNAMAVSKRTVSRYLKIQR
jgi:DNA invertase Pin-like site-specific DNA recombinase